MSILRKSQSRHIQLELSLWVSISSKSQHLSTIWVNIQIDIIVKTTMRATETSGDSIITTTTNLDIIGHW